MKILFLIDTLEVGGAEKSLLDILPRLRGFTPILCTLYPGQALKPAFEAAGIQVVSLDLPGKYSFLRAVDSVRAQICSHRPALIHATLMRASIVTRLAGRLEGVPVVNSLVSETYAAIRESGMTRLRRLKHHGMYLVDRITAPLVSHFIANSQAVKAASCQALSIPVEKVSVIYRGRDITCYAPSEGYKGAQRRAAGLAGDPLLLNVGRLLPSKGQGELIHAMPEILKHCPQAHLLIAGEGPYRPVLEGLLAELGLSDSVTLLGTRKDITQLLRAADLFVSPSHYEGLPGAVVEAMLAGVPVILSDMDVHREMVEDGVTGRLCPLKDVAALTGAIIDLLDHPARAQAMARQGRARAVELFDIEQVVSQHEKLYSQILREIAR